MIRKTYDSLPCDKEALTETTKMTLKNTLSCAITLVFFTCALTFAEKKPTVAPGKTGQEKQYGSVEERRIMESMQGESGSLLNKERDDLENKKKELKRLESEVDKKLDQLNQMRVRIEKLLVEKEAKEAKKIQELAKMYEKMTAEKAAMILSSVDQELAISILAKMKTKSAAKILNNIEREKAAKLSTAFSLDN
jgi:flagellar motility protein MotE (MotC chaperone)